jgi:DNA-binding beta-propeller fold protein YncE
MPCLTGRLALVAALTIACPAVGAKPVRIEPLWTLMGLAEPESAALSADGSFLYVSNVAGEGDAHDGNGFIARVARDGRLLEREWARGLDGPKGLALRGDRLYAADIDKLVEIDAVAGKVLQRYPAPGAKFLNDVAIAPGGEVLVSDSDTARIYVLRGGAMQVWAEDPKFRSINGLLPDKRELIVTTMQGLLLRVDWKSRAVTVLAEGLGDGDGVARLEADRYLVSEWPGRLFDVRVGLPATVVRDTRKEQIYVNDFLLVGDQLIMPSWSPGTLSAWRVLR